MHRPQVLLASGLAHKGGGNPKPLEPDPEVGRLGENLGDGAAEPSDDTVLLKGGDGTSLGGRADDLGLVQGLERVHAHDPRFDAIDTQPLSNLERGLKQPACRDDRQRSPLAHANGPPKLEHDVRSVNPRLPGSTQSQIAWPRLRYDGTGRL